MTAFSRYTSQDIQKMSPPFSTRDEFTPRELLDQAYLVNTDQYVEYMLHDGDRIDQLAFEFLGDSRLWNILAEMNPSVDPQFLPPGVKLRIPRVETNRG